MNAATPAPKHRLASRGRMAEALVKASRASPNRRCSIAFVPARASAIGSSAAQGSAAAARTARIVTVRAIESRSARARLTVQEEHLREKTRLWRISWDLSLGRSTRVISYAAFPTGFPAQGSSMTARREEPYPGFGAAGSPPTRKCYLDRNVQQLAALHVVRQPVQEGVSLFGP